MMFGTGQEDATRAVAWAIAEAWWRKTNRRAAGMAPEAESSEDYADKFWQGFCGEARAALSAMGMNPQPAPLPDRFA